MRNRLDNEILTSGPNRPPALEFSAALGTRSSICGRAVFITEDGHTGVGPLATLPGDQIWILGSPLQFFIMRPMPPVYSKEDDDDEWDKEWDNLLRNSVASGRWLFIFRFEG